MVSETTALLARLVELDPFKPALVLGGGSDTGAVARVLADVARRVCA
jgi:hypothetical protein